MISRIQSQKFGKLRACPSWIRTISIQPDSLPRGWRRRSRCRRGGRLLSQKEAEELPGSFRSLQLIDRRRDRWWNCVDRGKYWVGEDDTLRTTHVRGSQAGETLYLHRNQRLSF